MLLPKKSTILLLLLYYLAIQCSISRAIPSRSYWKTNQHNEGTNSPSDKPDFSYQPNTEQEANNFLQPRNFNEDLKINADGINIPKDVTKTYTVIVYTPTSQTPETVIVYTPTNSNQRTVIVYSPSSSPTGGSSKPPNETPTWTSSASSAAATIITTPNGTKQITEQKHDHSKHNQTSKPSSEATTSVPNINSSSTDSVSTMPTASNGTAVLTSFTTVPSSPSHSRSSSEVTSSIPAFNPSKTGSLLSTASSSHAAYNGTDGVTSSITALNPSRTNSVTSTPSASHTASNRTAGLSSGTFVTSSHIQAQNFSSSSEMTSIFPTITSTWTGSAPSLTIISQSASNGTIDVTPAKLVPSSHIEAQNSSSFIEVTSIFPTITSTWTGSAPSLTIISQSASNGTIDVTPAKLVPSSHIEAQNSSSSSEMTSIFPTITSTWTGSAPSLTTISQIASNGTIDVTPAKLVPSSHIEAQNSSSFSEVTSIFPTITSTWTGSAPSLTTISQIASNGTIDVTPAKLIPSSHIEAQNSSSFSEVTNTFPTITSTWTGSAPSLTTISQIASNGTIDVTPAKLVPSSHIEAQNSSSFSEVTNTFPTITSTWTGSAPSLTTISQIASNGTIDVTPAKLVPRSQDPGLKSFAQSTGMWPTNSNWTGSVPSMTVASHTASNGTAEVTPGTLAPNSQDPGVKSSRQSSGFWSTTNSNWTGSVPSMTIASHTASNGTAEVTSGTLVPSSHSQSHLSKSSSEVTSTFPNITSSWTGSVPSMTTASNGTAKVTPGTLVPSSHSQSHLSKSSSEVTSTYPTITSSWTGSVPSLTTVSHSAFNGTIEVTPAKLVPSSQDPGVKSSRQSSGFWSTTNSSWTGSVPSMTTVSGAASNVRQTGTIISVVPTAGGQGLGSSEQSDGTLAGSTSKFASSLSFSSVPVHSSVSLFASREGNWTFASRNFSGTASHYVESSASKAKKGTSAAVFVMLLLVSLLI